MEKQQGEFAAPAQPVMKQSHSKNGGLVALSIVSILVGVAGVGFGIYEATDKTDNNNSELKVQVENADGTISQLTTDKIKEISADGTTITISDNASTPYILLANYGNAEDPHHLAVNMPNINDYYRLSYTAKYESNSCTHISINAVLNIEGAQALPEFAQSDDDMKALAYVVACPKNIEYSGLASGPMQIGSTENFNIYYLHPQGLYSTISGEYGSQWEHDTVNALGDIFKNIDNYIEF